MYKVRVAFIFQVPSFWPSWEVLYNHLIQDERFSVRIFWLHGAQGDWSQMKMSEQFLIKNKIPYIRFSDKAVKRFNPHYMVYQTPFDKGHRPDYTWTIRYKRRGIKIIYIPYGIEIADTEEAHIKHFDRSVVLNAFAVYTLSDSMKHEYDKLCLNSDAVCGYGLPRIDSLSGSFELPCDIKAKKGNKKVLLWKTHFPKAIEQNGEYIQVTPDLNEYAIFADWVVKQEDYFVVFMPHPKFLDIKEKELGVDLLKVAHGILKVLKGCENVYVDTSDDYRNSLTNADLIIVDRSAIMVEAGIVGVPVLYMYNSEFDEPMTPPIAQLLNSYEKGTCASDMIGFAQKYLVNVDTEKEAREAVFNQIVVNDGHNSDRIVEDMFLRARDKWPSCIKPRFKYDSKVIFWGVGNIATFVLRQIQAVSSVRRPQIVCFVDNNSELWNDTICGFSIRNPVDIQSIRYDYVVITSDNYHRDIYLQLTNELSVPDKNVLNYDEFVVMMKYE